MCANSAENGESIKLCFTINFNLMQGITMKLVNNKLIIARILYGGLIHRQGLLQVGDRIVEVNQESVDSMNPSDLQALLVRWFTV